MWRRAKKRPEALRVFVNTVLGETWKEKGEAPDSVVVVTNFFGDFKRHDLGSGFWEKNFDGTIQREFITEPLWGVGSTAPYGHDGRSPTLEDVILPQTPDLLREMQSLARY